MTPSDIGTSPRRASLIATDTTIDGGVSGDGELHVDGLVRGDVAVAQLIISDSGRVEGAIKAESVEAHGRVVGSIGAKLVKLFAGCHVEGDITHEQLVIEAGAAFEGRSLKFQRSTPAALSGPPALAGQKTAPLSGPPALAGQKTAST